MTEYDIGGRRGGRKEEKGMNLLSLSSVTFLFVAKERGHSKTPSYLKYLVSQERGWKGWCGERKKQVRDGAKRSFYTRMHLTKGCACYESNYFPLEFKLGLR